MKDSQKQKKRLFRKNNKDTKKSKKIKPQATEGRPSFFSFLFSKNKNEIYLKGNKSKKKKPGRPSQKELLERKKQFEKKQKEKVIFQPSKPFDFKHYEKDFQAIIIILILYLILFGIYHANNSLTKKTAPDKNQSAVEQNKTDSFPFVKTDMLPLVSAKTAIIVDAKTQKILFSKNADLRFSMASTVKIMTGLIGLENFASNRILSVKSAGIEGSVLGLILNDSFYFDDVMYALLLPSANDAAVMIADNFIGGREEFIKKMNQKATQLHMTGTRFADPTGLDDDGNFTTVTDLSRLASYAAQIPEFTKYTSTKEKTITSLGLGKTYEFKNLNQLLGIDGVTGMKTGTTEGAGEVLITSVEINERVYIIIVMNSIERFKDTRILLNFINENVTLIESDHL